MMTYFVIKRWTRIEDIVGPYNLERIRTKLDLNFSIKQTKLDFDELSNMS